MTTQHVVMVSGGVTSFFTAKWVVDHYGTDGVTLLFADTKMEDEDLYRFLADTEAFIGVLITTVADGRTPWEVFRDQRFLGNSRVAPCSHLLKTTVLDAWVEAHCTPDDTVTYYGLTWEEMHRITKIRAQKAPWACRFPLCEKPYKTHTQWLDELARLGIRLPRLYTLGFPHNNCGGACVKAGQAQWARLWEVMPERYLWHEQQEDALRQTLGDVAILRDRSGGTTIPLPLRVFRQERLQGQAGYDDEEWGGCSCLLPLET